MDILASRADICAVLDWVNKRFGFQTGKISGAVRQYMMITPDGVKLQVKLPVGTADVLVIPEVTPGGLLKIRLVQIKVLGMGFLVKQLRAMAAKEILAQLNAYKDYIAPSLTDGNDILIGVDGVHFTAVSYLPDQLLLSAAI